MGTAATHALLDFDDDEFQSTPIPFGRPPGTTPAFGFGGFSSGQESPTSTVTPTGFGDRYDKSPFGHSRGDSVTSEDSNSSRAAPVPVRKQSTFAHSSQSSIAATTASPFSKKSSFASIRNAFKNAGKAVDPPPVPPLDYPVLKNPFNRSNSSLANYPPTMRRVPDAMSPPHPRPPTPGSHDPRTPRQTPRKGHAPARSQHSYSGSIYHNSDPGSDHGHNFNSSSPPPVPPVPNAFYGAHSDSPPPEMDDDRVEPDPRTPAEYALHAVFIRFATAAESKINTFLRQSLDHEPPLEDYMGPNIDPTFDSILQTLGRLGQKNAKPVVDSLRRWRRIQYDPVSPDIMRLHGSQSPMSLRNGVRTQDTVSILNERKSMAAIYIMCRALIVVMQSLSKDVLGEAMGYSLEETTFEQFKKPDLKLLTQSANQRANAELYATLLGHLANTRFTSVTDRFLSELTPVISGQVLKDVDMRFEHLVCGLKHIQIKVWPLESFEEGAEFMEQLAKAFDNTHGFRFKSAFAEALVHLLHPVAKTAQAEVNYPQWAKAIEIVHPKAKELASKPRYWGVAYSLVVVSLCVAPTEYFLRNWTSCFEAGLSKLKEKPFRIPVMNGMMRLIWTYMFRCRESVSASTSRIEVLLKHFFPANRLAIFPNEDHLEPFIYIVHFIFARHFDFGMDFIFGLMQEQAVKSASSNVMVVLSAERLTIAVQAILLTIHLMERDEQVPVWPSSSDFSGAPSWHDYPSSSDFLPPSILAKPNMQEFCERLGILLSHIAVACANAVGNMSVFDEQWSAGRLNPSYEETHNFIIRRHPDGVFAYSNNSAPQVTMLQTCFLAWPRCLHSSLPLRDAVDMLIRGVIHIEPSVGEAAVLAIRRFMQDPQHASAVLEKFASFLFSPSSIAQEGSSTKLVYENARLLNLWVSLVDGWVHKLLEQKSDTFQDEEIAEINSRLDEAEAGGLFLLCHVLRPIQAVGVKLLRKVGLATNHLWPRPSPSQAELGPNPLRLVDLLHGRGGSHILCDRFSHVLEPQDLDRLTRWREMGKEDVILRIADSEDPRDQVLWQWVYPDLMHYFNGDEINHSMGAMNVLRATLVAAEARFHSTLSSMAGLSVKVPIPPLSRPTGASEKDSTKMSSDSKVLTGQWHMWTKILCSIASIVETRPTLVTRDHNRAPSDANIDRDRWTTTRGLVRYLTPFLDSELSTFRDAAVYCISALPSKGYPLILDDMCLLLQRQLDESRMKNSTTYPSPDRSRRQERLFTAIARIFFLTAHCLQDTRFSGRQAALSPVLRFVRNVQAFLTTSESRDLFKLQRLRRYFCGTVERLFDGLTTLTDTDRFVPSNMHLSIYRLCEEWCQVGRQSESATQRLIVMQRSATSAVSNPLDRGEAVALFQRESKLLSKAAVGAMAALCAKAFFPPENSSGSPTDTVTVDYLRALDATSTLDRIHSFLASMEEPIQVSGKKALRSLLTHSHRDAGLVLEAMRLSFVTSKELATSNVRFFEVVADVICNVPVHGFKFAQVVCLGLFNLCHPILHIRRLALQILETTHEQSSGMLSISQYEAAVGSSAASVYLEAHRLISDVLAGEHPTEAQDVLMQFATWLPRVFDVNTTPLVLLQSLEYWNPNINLTVEDKSGLSREGRMALYHLITLTARFADVQAEQVQVFWTRLVDAPYQSNGHAAIRFLLEQAQRVGSAPYIQCSAKIVASLSHSAIGRQIIEELCSVIEPARMLPSFEHKLQHPEPDDVEFWSDLDVLFSGHRFQLGPGQFALLFLSNVALDRMWDLHDHFPAILHAIITHIDHRLQFVRETSNRMLFQLLRAWVPGYDELPDRSSHPSRSALKAAISDLEKALDSGLWKEDEHPTQSEPKMQSICSQILSILEPLYPDLRQVWGSLALMWGTACSIRPIAFRSLQLFRALKHMPSQNDMALLLGRLSNTVAAEDEDIQMFSAELFRTLKVLAGSKEVDISLMPQMFWCACACLATTVENEFLEVIALLEAVLTRLNLDDPAVVQMILAQSPLDWMGSTSLQSSLLVGLRSSKTSDATFKMLQILSRFSDSRLIEPSGARVRDLYTVALPWCLKAMTDDKIDPELVAFAEDVAYLAEQEERSSLGRVLTSFVKGRFRTKDDFLRQSVAGLREHYGPDDRTALGSLLLGLVLNQQTWLRVSSLQILKVFFQQREARNPVELMGSELLMPLLRLLETDLAPKALEVLEEPIVVSGGLPAKQVLRMSMVMKPLRKDRERESVGDVFGVPEESGWCIARPHELRERCRANVVAVFDTCKVPSRPSQIVFEPEDAERPPAEESGGDAAAAEDDLGNLVQNLHELSTFFQDAHPLASKPGGGRESAVPSQQLAARVAAILAKSSESAPGDMPQTPFVDVFRVESL
ncbi:cell morphogenesis N-terminal-domain-containing protein, partial [Amylostereum chailletii]